MRLPHGLTTKEQMMSTYTPNETDSPYGRGLKPEELENVSGGTFWDRVIAYNESHQSIGTVAADTATGGLTFWERVTGG
jgi:hypothetical protein